MEYIGAYHTIKNMYISGLRKSDMKGTKWLIKLIYGTKFLGGGVNTKKFIGSGTYAQVPALLTTI